MEQKKDNNYVRAEHNRHHAEGQQNNSKANGFGYIMSKAEKLTTALYLVSDIMSDKEPMKWTMRETGVNILSDITVGSTDKASARITDLRQVMKKIEQIVSFLDIAQSTRLLSEMNATVLKKEYMGLRRDVEAEWNRTYEQGRVVLTESFFNVPHVDELSSGVHNDGVAQKEEGHTKKIVPPSAHTVTPLRVVGEAKEIRAPETPVSRVEHVNTTPLAPVVPMTGGKREEISMAKGERPLLHVERLSEVKPVVRPVVTLRDAITHARTDVVRPRSLERERSEIGSTLVVRDDRRKIILALIKQKSHLTVKDITKSIPSVSEKTIQRELLAMVEEGILEKHGERRWSTYSLSGE